MVTATHALKGAFINRDKDSQAGTDVGGRPRALETGDQRLIISLG